MSVVVPKARMFGELGVAQFLHQVQKHLSALASPSPQLLEVDGLGVSVAPEPFLRIPIGLFPNRIPERVGVEVKERGQRDAPGEMEYGVVDMMAFAEFECFVRPRRPRFGGEKGGIGRQRGMAVDAIAIECDPEGPQISVFQDISRNVEAFGRLQRPTGARQGVVERDDAVDFQRPDLPPDERFPIPAIGRAPNAIRARRRHELAAFDHDPKNLASRHLEGLGQLAKDRSERSIDEKQSSHRSPKKHIAWVWPYGRGTVSELGLKRNRDLTVHTPRLHRCGRAGAARRLQEFGLRVGVEITDRKTC